MIHSPELTDKLSAMEVEEFTGEVYRATRKSLNPLAASSSGGRWMPRNETSVLYTSLSHDGALAELVFHWGMLTPLPTKQAVMSKIGVNINFTLRILRTDFVTLGINEAKYGDLDYKRMQEIGAAVAFIECHGLIVPSARWNCENLVIFTENVDSRDSLELVQTTEIDWQAWGSENGFLN